VDETALASNIQRLVQTAVRDGLSAEDLLRGLLRRTPR